MTPVANLPLVSLKPVVHLDLRISPRIFEKIRNDAKVIIRGLGEDDSWKKPEAKNLVTLSLEKDSVRRFFASGFFHESVSPQPQSIPLRPFRSFSKIHGDIRESRCTTAPVSATPVANFSTIFASVVDTGGKFATGVNDAGGKYATGINDAGGKFATGVVDTRGK